MSKKTKFTKEDFLELFKEIKTVEKKRKATTKGLGTQASNNLKKLVARGYDQEDFRKAITQMFNDPGQWAVNNGADTPDHILVEKNFDRYLNAAENAENLKKIKEAEVAEKKEVKKEVVVAIDLEAGGREEEKKAEAKQVYTKSLDFGKWIGTMQQANEIGVYFAECFSKEEKAEIFKGCRERYGNLQARAHATMTAQELIMRAITTSEKLFSEEIVKKAVERKIPRTWKK